MSDNNLRFSKNSRESVISDVKVFLEREHVDRAKTVEVVCSSSRRDMDDHSIHTPYRLFSHTFTLNSETMKEWPQQTDVYCWHCCHSFDTVPLPIPKTKSIYEAHNIYHVYGVFCSCNCAVAYLLERNTHDQQHLLLRFKEMAMNVFKIQGVDTNVYVMNAAPPRIFLKVFGGHLTIEEFRHKSLTTRTTLLTPPFVSFRMMLEESVRNMDMSKSDTSATSTAPITNHAIRGLRRPTLREDEEMAAPKNDADTSLFSKFITSKQSEGVHFAQGEAKAGDKRAPAKRSHRRTSTKGAPFLGGATSGGEGTLAAFLKPSSE